MEMPSQSFNLNHSLDNKNMKVHPSNMATGFSNRKMTSTVESVVSYHDVSYSVKFRNRPCAAMQEKQVLCQLSGTCRTGLNAIMGPTGSGKTSLLDVLAGRKNPEGLSGEVLINGKLQPKNFKCISGYVSQDDVVMGTMSVRENFMFSANVRLSNKISHKEKEERVQSVIDELGLQSCAETKVGNQFIRGVSGGERKRTNIGMELIIQPTILFLDEPTTGLDANTANSVVQLLKQLSERNRVVIMSIHQPRYSIYKTFDNLILLGKGQLVYQGPPMEGLDFFSSVGYVIEEHNNPADFYLDVINGGLQQAGDGVLDQGHRNAHIDKVTDGAFNKTEATEDLSEFFHGKFKQSQWFTRLRDELQAIETYRGEHKDDKAEDSGEGYQTSFFTQFRHLSYRAMVNIVRNPQTSVMQVMVMAMLALIVGGLYFDVPDSSSEGLQNRIGGLFFIIMNQVFSNFGAVELFITERKLFLHENIGGFYRTSSYFISKVLFDMVPLRLLPAVVLSCIAYFMIGFQREVEKFFLFLLTLFLVSMCGSAFAFLWSATAAILAVATLLIAMTFILMMVFGGLIVNVESIWVGLRWLQYISIFRYAFSSLCINELKGLEFCVYVNDTCSEEVLAGETFMMNNGIDFESDWDYWQNIMALGIILIGVLFFAYVQLRRIPRYT